MDERLTIEDIKSQVWKQILSVWKREDISQNKIYITPILFEENWKIGSGIPTNEPWVAITFFYSLKFLQYNYNLRENSLEDIENLTNEFLKLSKDSLFAQDAIDNYSNTYTTPSIITTQDQQIIGFVQFDCQCQNKVKNSSILLDRLITLIRHTIKDMKYKSLRFYGDGKVKESTYTQNETGYKSKTLSLNFYAISK